MHRSSESIGAIAAALAKAQVELVNPEKSLTATIAALGAHGGDKTFRYASLSSGLDIVRKSLGAQEIAAVQTTAIDNEAGLVRLTTVLAHSSGEWISSEWPVCAVSETATPHRMGAALTYARRYALFTLVGIAGEDDLDAPDVHDRKSQSSGPAGNRVVSLDDGARFPSRSASNGHARAVMRSRAMIILDPDNSATLREKLLTEIGNLTSAEVAVTWARGVLSAKDTLTANDAKVVEEGFEQKLSKLAATEELSSSAPLSPSTAEPTAGSAKQVRQKTRIAKVRPTKGIDKSVLAIATPRRYRNKAHLRYVAQQECLVCARKPSDPHHLRFMQPRALGRKASDEFTVPLCRGHHRAVHRTGDEAGWWKEAGIDPIKVARKLWKETRVSEGHLPPSDRASKPHGREGKPPAS